MNCPETFETEVSIRITYRVNPSRTKTGVFSIRVREQSARRFAPTPVVDGDGSLGVDAAHRRVDTIARRAVGDVQIVIVILGFPTRSRSRTRTRRRADARAHGGRDRARDLRVRRRWGGRTRVLCSPTARYGAGGIMATGNSATGRRRANRLPWRFLASRRRRRSILAIFTRVRCSPTARYGAGGVMATGNSATA